MLLSHHARRTILAGLLLAGVALAGCDSSTSDDVSPQQSTASPAVSDAWKAKETLGGVKPSATDTLRLAYPNDPDTLNVLTASDNVSSAFHRWVYEGLAEQSYENPDELLPSLATSWEFDEENLEYTIHLRKGVMWHPIKLPNGKLLAGREFTARDVKFSFDCVLNPVVESPNLRSYFEDPAADADNRYKIKVEVVDDYTVKIRWNQPYFLAEEVTLSLVPIIPRHVFSVDENGELVSLDFTGKEFADAFNDHWANRLMCGTGPLMFEEWRREERLVLRRNPNYWGAPFYFNEVVFSAESNPNTLLQKILQGNLDWAGIAQKDQFVQSEDHPNVVAGKLTLESFESPGYRYIGYNMRHPFLSDRKVRTALTHAVPVQEIIDKVFLGLAVPTSGPFQPGTSAYNDELKLLAFDLNEARRLLDEAGWKDSDDNGVRDKQIDGRKVEARYTFMIYADSPIYLTVAQIVKDSCRKIGVDVVIEPAKWALMLTKLKQKDFDSCMLGWTSTWKPDPFQIWHGSQADVPDSSNSIGYSNPQVDKLIEELRVTFDRDKQIELYHEIHRLIYEDQPYTFLLVDMATAGLHGRIENVNFYKIVPGYDAREWYATEPASR